MFAQAVAVVRRGVKTAASTGQRRAHQRVCVLLGYSRKQVAQGRTTQAQRQASFQRRRIQFNLDQAVGRARVGCDAMCWQGVTMLRAHGREDEQRRQRAAARLNRVRSALIRMVTVAVVKSVNVHI